MAVGETILKKMKESLTKPIGKGNAQDIELTFYAPQANKIFLAGTFNDWSTNTLPMKKGKDGVWRVKVKMSPGRYEYKYFVDGAWSQELSGSDVVTNPFGTQNCVIGIH